MPSLDNLAKRSRYLHERSDLARIFFPTGQQRIARGMVIGLALWIAGIMTGCGGEGGTAVATPEQKEKQGVVQNKMKDFMKQSKLPNRPR